MIKSYYGITYHNKPITEKEYIELLNILEANEETIESFYKVVNNDGVYCGTYSRNTCFKSSSEVYESLIAHFQFMTESDFIEWIMSEIQECIEADIDYSKLIYDYTYGTTYDTKIFKTKDGYVVRFDY